MTIEQIEYLIRDESVVSIYTIGSDAPFVGKALIDAHTGLIVMHDNETFIEPTQVAAISLFDAGEK